MLFVISRTGGNWTTTYLVGREVLEGKLIYVWTHEIEAALTYYEEDANKVIQELIQGGFGTYRYSLIPVREDPSSQKENKG